MALAILPLRPLTLPLLLPPPSPPLAPTQPPRIQNRLLVKLEVLGPDVVFHVGDEGLHILLAADLVRNAVQHNQGSEVEICAVDSHQPLKFPHQILGAIVLVPLAEQFGLLDGIDG